MTMVFGSVVFSCFSKSSAVETKTVSPSRPPMVPAFSLPFASAFAAYPSSPLQFSFHFWAPSPVYAVSPMVLFP